MSWGIDTSRRPHLRRARRTGVAVLAATMMFACSSEAGQPGGTPTPAPSESTEPPSVITVGVYGPPDELAAWEVVVESFNATSPSTQATLSTWPDRETAINVLETTESPDVFLSSMRELEGLVATAEIQPVGELLDEREVDFGDGYERTALRAFGRENALQCMPYGMSPQVIYYNTKLIDFDKMRARGLLVPEFPEDRARAWNFDQFTAAAEFAARPARRIRGFYFEPSLTGLSPLLYAAGGPVFDDEELPPVTTQLSSEDGVEALETLLPVLRKSQLNLSPVQLEKADPVEWFMRGKLGMIAADHSLVPLLRRTDDLAWDVLPFPFIDEFATVGDMTGLCMSADAPPEEAADFIVHAISAESVATVAEAGYFLPTNLEVSESEEFLASGDPLNARVFNDSIRRLQLVPSQYITPALEEAVGPGLTGLLNATLPDVEAMTLRIDEASQVVLAPPEPGSSGSPTPTPSP